MAENAEGRFKRAMDRLFPSAPPSVGRDGSKSSTTVKPLSKTNARVVEFSAQQEKKPPILHHICRPWDRGDLFLRLSSYKSMTWFGKPEVAGPLICARNGWVNVDVDLIACEGCNAMLSIPCQPTWSQHEVDNAAATFSKKLESGHTSLCPWKGNACLETLAQFPPTPVEVLVDGFQDRCNALYQLSALPALSKSTIEFLKQSKEPQMERFITHSTTNYAPQNETLENSADVAYFQAQRIISLCGWELRCLPYVVDCEDDNADFLGKTTPSVTDSSSVNTRLNDYGPRVVLYPSMKDWENKTDKCSTEGNRDLGSAVLDCSLCGASVGLWFFSKISRPSNRTRAEPVIADTDCMVCEVSAASEIQKGSCDDQIGVDVKRSAKEDAVTSNRLTVDAKPSNMLTLNLTIAGGPCPSFVSQPVASRLANTSDNDDAQDGSQAGKMTLSSEIVEDKDATALSIKKRKRNVTQERTEALGMSPCLSSVNAVDTCFSSRRENSAESVEMPSNYQQSTPTTMESSHCKRQRFPSDGAGEHTTSCKAFRISDGKTGLIDFEHGSERTASLVLDENEDKGSTFKKLFEDSSKEFDPILQHRHFCPWVNTSFGRAKCGWQLTLDALEASPAVVKSESASSSKYNVNPLSSVRKIFGKPQRG